MRLLVLLCVVAGAMASCDLNDQQDVAEGQEARLHTIQEKMANIRADADKRIKKADELEEDIAAVKAHLKKLEPTGCDDRYELQCGGDRPKCLSRLLVCDTFNDCDNGYDESECATITPSGSIWKGTMVYDHCTVRQPKTLRFSVDNYKIIDYFRPFPEITATVAFDPDSPDYDSSTDVQLHGWMDLMPGNHIVYYEPPDGSGLATLCIFDGKDNDHCHGEIVRESSQEVCAEFYAERLDRYN